VRDPSDHENDGQGDRVRRWLGRSIGLRLLLLVVSLCVCAGILCGVGLMGMSSGSERLRIVYQDHVEPLQMLSEVQSDLTLSRLDMITLGSGLVDGDKATETMRDAVERDERVAQRWRAFEQAAAGQDGLGAVSAALNDYRRLHAKEVAAIKADDAVGAAQALGATADTFASLSKRLQDLIRLKTGAARSEYEAARANSATVRLVVIAFGLGLLGAAGAASLLAVGSVTNPLNAIAGAVRAMADGALDVEVPARERLDEVGRIAQAVQTFKEELIAAARLSEERAAEQRARLDRSEKVEELVAGFDHAVSEILHSVSDSLANLDHASEVLTANASRTNTEAGVVIGASSESASSMQAVAAAAEQLSASITEIGRQIEQATQISRAASVGAERASVTVEGLNASSRRIGEVVDMIGSIAGQTNLLALNAAIEAARAGSSGKGFVVVANEVKLLAGQAAKASSDIARQIAGIQAVTEEVVSAIRTIVGQIGAIDAASSAIAAAVEEQSAATTEIARNVQQAAVSADQVLDSLGGVRAAGEETGAEVKKNTSAVKSLSLMAADLRNRIDDFLADVRNA